MSEESKPITVRPEPDLFERIRARAKRGERSLNKEVIYILKEYFSKHPEAEAK
jgi:predicted HicB family RNase H-like nuclease